MVSRERPAGTRMAQPRLFVRSNKTNIVTGSVFVDGLGGGPQRIPAKTTHTTLSPNDAQAKDLLKRSGVEFELVDLSKGVKASIVAMIRGVRETPTLEVRHGPVKRYVGLKSISEYLSETGTRTQS